jgi:hypothetical protein
VLFTVFDLGLIGILFLPTGRTSAIQWEDSKRWLNPTEFEKATFEAVPLPRMAPRTVMVGPLWCLGHTLLTPAQLACSILAQRRATCGLRGGHIVEGKRVESEEL